MRYGEEGDEDEGEEGGVDRHCWELDLEVIGKSRVRVRVLDIEVTGLTIKLVEREGVVEFFRVELWLELQIGEED